jgi:hypothetical protein
VLADKALRETEAIRVDKCVPVFPKTLPPLLSKGVDRHRKKSEVHPDLEWRI